MPDHRTDFAVHSGRGRSQRLLAYLSGHGRLAEWCTAGVIVGFALTLLLPGPTIGSGASWSQFDALLLNDGVIGVAMLMIGAARLVALWINGRARISPTVRMVGAVCGVGVYWSLVMMFAWPWLAGSDLVHGRGLTTAVATYFLLGCTDVISSWRAGADAGAVAHHSA